MGIKINRHNFISAALTGLVFATGPAMAEERESWLFMETAQHVEFADGQLILTGIDDQVIAFSDRPFRDTSMIPLTSIIENWGKGENSFASDPPNAALTGTHEGKQFGLIVTINNPRLDNGVLRFDYVTAKSLETTQLDAASLVVDNLYNSLQCAASWGEDC